MKTLRYSLMFLAGAAAAFAQQWEIGGTVGGSFLPNVSVSSPPGSATTGFRPGLSAGAFLGQTISRRIGGEVRYTFMMSDLKLASGGTSATFSGQTHAVYYDLVIHTARRESRAQVFAAVGGGMKIFRGTGHESAYQPLSQFAYFTKTQAVKPMLSVGAGAKFRIAQHMALRAEFRDFITPFPQQLIMPAPGAKFGRLLHDFVPMVGISYEY